MSLEENMLSSAPKDSKRGTNKAGCKHRVKQLVFHNKKTQNTAWCLWKVKGFDVLFEAIGAAGCFKFCIIKNAQC